MKSIGSRKKKVTALIAAMGVAFYGNAGFSAPAPSANPADFIQNKPVNLLDLSIPKEIGSIKETFKGQDEKVVFVIQDAHEIPDAQRNIQKLINFLQTQYGVRLVALEGAASDLDPQIFKSFPDQTFLKKVFEQYFDNGELAGGTAAAIFTPSPAVYHGVEDWSLYEEGLKHFLDAMEMEESITKHLDGMFEELKQEKEKHYSKELLDLDLALQTFRKNAADLVTILEKLATVRPPDKGSELALLLEEVGRSRDNSNSVEMEVKRIADQIRTSLRARPNPKVAQSQRREVGGRAKRSNLHTGIASPPSAPRNDDLIEFNQKLQEFQTQRITPEAFALFLKGLAIKYRIRVKVSKRLNYLVGNQKRMKDIQGTKFFDDLEKYAQSVKEALFQSDEERKLDARSHQLELMERLAKLELSREDWNQVKDIAVILRAEGPKDLKSQDSSPPSAAQNDGIARLLQQMRPQVSFYHNAGKRDHAFIQQVSSLFQKHNAKSAAFIAGGFHAEGVTYALKSKGISYVLVMPRINRVPDETAYRDHMKGEVSWGDYFEVRDGKVNLYNAFVRGTRDKLLSAVIASPEGAKQSRGRLLKSWRDQIIRDLAEKGRLTETGQYTRFIDELTTPPSSRGAPEGRRGDLLAQWEANINRFIEGLRHLRDEGRITEENIANLLQPATMQVAIPLARSELRVDLIPKLETILLRSEARVASQESSEGFRSIQNFRQIGPSGVPKLAEEDGIGMLANVSPDSGYGRILAEQDFVEIAALLSRANLGGILPLIGYTRTKLYPGYGSSSFPYLVLGLQHVDDVRYRLRLEILIPDVQTGYDDSLRRLVDFYPAQIIEAYRQFVLLLSQEERVIAANVIRNNPSPSLPPWDETTLAALTKAGVLHEIGEVIWMIIEANASDDQTDPEIKQTALRFFENWRDVFMGEPHGPFMVKNILKNRLGHPLIREVFADKFARFVTGEDAIYRNFETLSTGQDKLFREIPALLSLLESKTGDAFSFPAPRSEVRTDTVKERVPGTEGTGSAERSEVRAEPGAEKIIADILDSKRTLWFQGNAESADAALLEEARKRNQKYLRVTLRRQEDLERLMRIRHIPDGTPFTEVPPPLEGPLFEILRQGGILLIDYAGSDPKLVEGFDPLFDPEPYFEKIKDISKELHIVGVMPEDQFDGHSVSFYTRSLRVRDHPAPAGPDPIESIQSRAPPEDFDGIRVDLFRALETRNEIIGRLVLDEKGSIRVLRKGAVLRALEEGKPLLIRGGDWKQSDLAHLIRQALVTGWIFFNGEWAEVPEDFAQRIYTEEVDYSQGVRDKTIVSSEESRSQEPLWVINRDTQDILFERTRVGGSGPGLLEEKTLHLRITDNLADEVWHRILHSGAEIEIEVLPGVSIPAAYESSRSQKQRDALRQEVTKGLEEVRDEKSFLIQGSDETYILEKIRRTYPREKILWRPVTPETALDQLTASVEIKTEKGGIIFVLDTKEVLEALEAGKTVVLTGLEANPGLRRDLETVLQSRPYLVINGQRVELSELKGRLILVSAPEGGSYETGARRVKMEPEDQEIADMLQALYPRRFTPDSYQKILELKKIFSTLPAPSEPGLYPLKPNFEFSRLKLLYSYDNWLEAFEDVFIVDYADQAEASAFMRTMVRLVFETEETGRKPDAIHGAKLRSALNRTPGRVPWQKNVWQFMETLGIGLLKKAGVSQDFKNPRSRDIFGLIQKALVKHHEGERAEAYRVRFGMGKDEKAGEAPEIDEHAPAAAETWRERKDRITRALELARMVMLKGPPGTGKSFSTEEISRELGYKNGEIFGPVTTGSDTKEADVVGKRTLEAGGTKFDPGKAAKWAGLEQGGLLIVDEANLTDPDFWNFLMGLAADKPFVWVNGRQKMLSPRHRVIFTGNQETLTGRRFQKLLARHAVTVRFDEFPEAFLKERVNEYLPVKVRDREALTDLILNLHQWFSRMDPSLGFSLRDVQELAVRVSLFAGADWEEEKVVQTAWHQYAPSLTPEKRLAAEHLLAHRYGILVDDGVREKIEAARLNHEKSFREKGIVPVASSLYMASLIDDALAVRAARLGGKSRIPGKRGMIFEGPSGRGKDEVVKLVLGDAKLEFDPVTASMNYEQMEAAIGQNQQKGTIGGISEMNLLPTGLLEGKFNDVLTGKAAEGFMLLATINSADFSGRERLSTALQNRVLYVRMEDYPQEELREIANEKAPNVSSTERTLLVNLHAWIRDEAGGVHRQPTTRELVRALEMMKAGASRQEAVQEVYGPIFLKRILKGKTAPSDEKLVNYRERKRLDDFTMFAEIANFVVPEALRPVEIRLDASVPEDRGGYWESGDGSDKNPSSITLRTSGVGERLDLETLIHESSHGRFTRTIPGLTPLEGDPLDPLYQDLEDLRHIPALKKHFFPKAGFNRSSEAELDISRLTQTLDAGGVIGWLDARREKRPLRLLFQALLTAYAKGLVTKAQLEAMAQVMEGVYEANPFALARKHADRVKTYQEAVPQTLDEEEIWYEQYRALKILHEMAEDFREIPEGGVEEELSPEPTKTEQAQAIEEAKKRLVQGGPIKPVLQQAPPAGERAAPSEVPAGEKIEAAKKALEEKRRQIREATKKTVRQALALMQSDLTSWGGVTRERLTEIEEQLINPKHPYSLVGKIEQLKDKTINQEVKRILDLVNRMKMHIKEAKSGAPSNWVLGVLSGLLQWLGITTGGGQRAQPVGLRHPPPQDLSHKAATRYRPQPAKPPEPKRNEQSLSASETDKREPRMERVSEDRQSELDRALSGFFYQKLDPDKIYGSEGILDIDRFLETGDPAVSRRRSGGRVEQKKKEIILLASPGRFHAKVIFTELFHYLFSQGFRVTVYINESEFVEGIQTVGDLKAVLNRASPEIKRSEIEKDMKRRRPAGNYEITTIEELQRKVEALYLYGAFKLAHVGEEPEKRKGAEKGTGRPSLEEALSLDAQFEQAKRVLRENRIEESRALKKDEEIEINLSDLALQDDTLARLAAELNGLTNLQHLNLSGTQVTDKGLKHLKGLTNLQHLNLSGTRVTDKGLKHLKGLTNLQYLNLYGTRVTDEGLKHLKGLTNLQVLDLYGTQVTDEGLEHLKGLTNLQVLNLSGTQVTDEGLEHLKGLTNLQHLYLYGTRVTDEGLKHLKGLTNLQVLNLYGTRVTDEGLEHLKDLTNLQHLNLYGTRVTDEGLEHLKGLTNLQRLYLYGIRVTDEGLKRFIGAHPQGESLSVYHSQGIPLSWKDVPEGYKQSQKLLSRGMTFLKTIVDSLVTPAETIALVRARFSNEGKTEWFEQVLNSLRSEVRKSGGVQDTGKITELDLVAVRVIDALNPDSGEGLTRSEVRQIYILSTSDFKGFTDAILETWLNRTKDRQEVSEERLEISQAAIAQTQRLIDWLTREDRKWPEGKITFALLLGDSARKESFLTQLLDTLKRKGQAAQVFPDRDSQSDVQKKIDRIGLSSLVSSRPLDRSGLLSGIDDLYKNGQSDVPIALLEDAETNAGLMSESLVGLALDNGKAPLNAEVLFHNELLFSIIVGLFSPRVMKNADYQNSVREKINKISESVKGDPARLRNEVKRIKSETLKEHLIPLLEELGYDDQGIFSTGSGQFLTLAGGVIAGMLTEIQARSEVRKAA